MTITYEDELRVAVALARKASEAILPLYYDGFEQSTKSDGTPVTNADVLANKIIQEGLHKAFPDDGIVSEELEDILGERTWYIDPIDGTRSFCNRTDQFAVHIGLAQEGLPVVGVVYKPVGSEYFYATKGGGAYRMTPLGLFEQLIINQEDHPLTLVVDNDFLVTEPGRTVYEKLQPHRHLVLGSEGLRIMPIAQGNADVHLIARSDACSTWDLCAPHVIAEEAGAYVAYADGNPIRYHGQRKLGKFFVVAKNEELGKRASAVLQEVCGRQ